MTATTPEAGRNARLSSLLFQANQELADVKAQLTEAYRIAEQERKRADRAGRDVDRLDHRCAELKAEVDDVTAKLLGYAREAVEREEALKAEIADLRQDGKRLTIDLLRAERFREEAEAAARRVRVNAIGRWRRVVRAERELEQLRAAMARPLIPDVHDCLALGCAEPHGAGA